ncbi:MAG: BBP7 family outer membrane beta-barrel protein [Planctomycetota bacterium]|jgi:hypothetical protein
MKLTRVLTVVTIVWSTACHAQAQIGLYGAPSMLELPSLGPGDSGFPASPYQPVGADFYGADFYGSQPQPETAAKRSGSRRRNSRTAPGRRSESADDLLDLYDASPLPPPPNMRKAPLSGPTPAPELTPTPAPEIGPPPFSAPSLSPGAEAGFEYGAAGGAAYCGWPRSCGTRWYVSLEALMMGRNQANQLWTTYEATNNANQIPTDSDFRWRFGGQIRVGRCVGCAQRSSLEAIYWTLEPFSSFASRTHPNGVSTPLDFTDVVWANLAGPPDPADLFDGAQEHRVWRSSELHSLELSFVRNPIYCLCYDPYRVSWLVGFRFFRFDDRFLFGSLDQPGPAFGLDPTMEGYLYDRVENNLFGVQFGVDMGYQRGNWRLYFTPRVGIYNNHIRHYFHAYRGDGEPFAPAPAGYPPYPVN